VTFEPELRWDVMDVGRIRCRPHQNIGVDFPEQKTLGRKL
jgi:hypothetical protein